MRDSSIQEAEVDSSIQEAEVESSIQEAEVESSIQEAEVESAIQEAEVESAIQEAEVESANEKVSPYGEVITINEDLQQLIVRESTSLYIWSSKLQGPIRIHKFVRATWKTES